MQTEIYLDINENYSTDNVWKLVITTGVYLSVLIYNVAGVTLEFLLITQRYISDKRALLEIDVVSEQIFALFLPLFVITSLVGHHLVILQFGF